MKCRQGEMESSWLGWCSGHIGFTITYFMTFRLPSHVPDDQGSFRFPASTSLVSLLKKVNTRNHDVHCRGYKSLKEEVLLYV